MTLQVDIVSSILIRLIPITALLLGVVLVLYAYEVKWHVQVKQGLKGVLVANSDSWALVQFKRPVWISWCLAVQEVRVFVYQYSRS